LLIPEWIFFMFSPFHGLEPDFSVAESISWTRA
jgi:hypothetical protein